MTFDGSTILHDQAMSPSQTRRRSSARRPLSEISNSPAVRKSLGLKQEQVATKPAAPPTIPAAELSEPSSETIHSFVGSESKTDWAYWASICVAVVAMILISFASVPTNAPVVSPIENIMDTNQIEVQAQDFAAHDVDRPEELDEVDFVPEPIEVDADEAEDQWEYHPSDGSEEFTSEESEGDAEMEAPWEAAMISGPLHLVDLDDTGSFEGFARLTQIGELYLFFEPSDDFPAGMVSLDGCQVDRKEYLTSSPLCFPLPTTTRVLEACVSDVEEAMDWVAASRSIEC